MKRNWSYIAGFFDGEGCIQNVNGAVISITQKRIKVLQEIQAFLADQGIKSGISTRKSGVSSLFITKTKDTLRFLKELYPYLIVKKLEAQDIIRYFTIWPIRSTRLGKDRFICG